MQIHYLEIVTNEVDAVCALHTATHNIRFSEPVAALGGARTTTMENGSLIGIRAPMHEQELPVVRPYMLTQDIEAAVASAVKSGAVLAVPPMELPGYGLCAILMQNDSQIGLWQLSE